jgi:hydrogenase nickel incorporation protein HypA/HybF
MHEMSIALSVIDAVTTRALQEGGGRVTEIELAIGSLAGVQLESLRFCFSAASRGTLAEHAEIVIHERHAEAQCVDCSSRFAIGSYLARCPVCAGYRFTVVSGEEFSIQSITIE